MIFSAPLKFLLDSVSELQIGHVLLFLRHPSPVECDNNLLRNGVLIPLAVFENRLN